MNKILSALLAVAMIFSAVALSACGSETTLKFGLGVYTNVSAASDATEDKDGEGKVAITVAAVTVDAAGKIVACDIDTIENTVKYTTEGKALANDSFQSKYEKKEAYGMKKYSAVGLEWYEQADAFEKVVCGKTLTEVKALIAEGGKGTDEVMTAGCTITISDFVYAVEKAYNNAADSKATAKSTLKVAVYNEQSLTDATEEKAGKNQVDTTVFAAALDANGKVIAASTDCVQVKFTFDATGASTVDLTKSILTKKELGLNYNMKNSSPVGLEWYEQAANFEALTLGKTVAEIVGLMVDGGMGTDEVKAAGCAIKITGFVKAAEKLG